MKTFIIIIITNKIESAFHAKEFRFQPSRIPLHGVIYFTMQYDKHLLYSAVFLKLANFSQFPYSWFNLKTKSKGSFPVFSLILVWVLNKNRQHFSMVLTLFHRRNDFKIFKTQVEPRASGEWSQLATKCNTITSFPWYFCRPQLLTNPRPRNHFGCVPLR